MDIRKDTLERSTKWFNNFIKVSIFQGDYDEKYRLQLELNFFQTKPYSGKWTLISYV